MSKTLHTRPSEFLQVTDPLAALHFDRAVVTFGQALDHALDKAVTPKKKGKKLSEAQRNYKIATELEKWLGITGIKRFRDPMSTA